MKLSLILCDYSLHWRFAKSIESFKFALKFHRIISFNSRYFTVLILMNNRYLRFEPIKRFRFSFSGFLIKFYVFLRVKVFNKSDVSLLALLITKILELYLDFLQSYHRRKQKTLKIYSDVSNLRCVGSYHVRPDVSVA